MSDALEVFTESVAIHTREVAVAEAMVKEHTTKLRLAEDEVHAAHRKLETARANLADASVRKHEAVHGKPVSFDDRMAFEKRWDARIDEQNARIEAYRQSQAILDTRPKP